ncbi:anti-sigma factor [Pseudonocardia spinosispora]|uniref:anti-sigma factor n=1 Tax=Pseudonocardia spinosispora TaxID=103441 RepID=UPI0004092764|nr:anti-sigma factor [Pseudonocardia spinosispora]
MSARPQCPQAELAVGWALHSLEPGDDDVVIEHLPSCPICREAIQQTEELMWLLGPAHEQVTPRPELRDELLSAMGETPQTPETERDGPWPPASGMPEGQSVTVGWHRPGEVVSNKTALERHAAQQRLARKRRTAAIAATVMISLIGVGGVAYWQVQVSQQQEHVQAERPAQLSQILSVIDQPGARHAVLNAPGGEPVAGVMLTADGQREVYPFTLSPNDPTHSIYVLWGIDANGPVAIAGFDVSRTDNGLRPVGSMPRADAYLGYLISIERGRTLPDSPQLMVATGQVAN